MTRHEPVLSCLLVLVCSAACKREPASSSTHDAPESRYALGQRPSDVVLVDVDGDARLDAVATSPQSRELHVLRGDGRGGFARAVGIYDASAFHAVAAADIDADGDADLLTTEHDAHDIDVLLGDGRGGFTAAKGAPGPLTPRPYSLALGDVTGDGRNGLVDRIEWVDGWPAIHDGSPSRTWQPWPEP